MPADQRRHVAEHHPNPASDPGWSKLLEHEAATESPLQHRPPGGSHPCYSFAFTLHVQKTVQRASYVQSYNTIRDETADWAYVITPAVPRHAQRAPSERRAAPRRPAHPPGHGLKPSGGPHGHNKSSGASKVVAFTILQSTSAPGTTRGGGTKCPTQKRP